MDNGPGRQAVDKGASVRLKYIRRCQRIGPAGMHAIFSDSNNVLSRVDSNDNTSDLFTKGLQKEKLELALRMLDIENFPPPVQKTNH